MPIDVQDPALNLTLNFCLFGIAAAALLSLVPWPLRRGRGRWSLWLPLPALALYAVYEATMPSRMDIRLDLVLIWPLLATILLGWTVRLLRLRWLRRRERPDGGANAA